MKLPEARIGIRGAVFGSAGVTAVGLGAVAHKDFSVHSMEISVAVAVGYLLVFAGFVAGLDKVIDSDALHGFIEKLLIKRPPLKTEKT